MQRIGALAPRLAVYFFVDGIVVHARAGRVHELREELKNECGLRSHLARPRDGRAGHLLILRSLAKRTCSIDVVVGILEAHRATLEKIELAVDVTGLRHPERAEARILANVRLHRWPNAEPRRGAVDRVAYWLGPHASVNVASYCDRESKLERGLFRYPALHVELRLQGRELEARGWRAPTALLELEVQRIMDVMEEETNLLDFVR